MKKYYRIILGRGSAYATEAYEGNFIGIDYGIPEIMGLIPEDHRAFNAVQVPRYLELNPDKSKISAGLACGMIHTVISKIAIGDIILSPSGSGYYYVGEVTGDYRYVTGGSLPHRRSVQWYGQKISRDDMSESLKNSTGSIGTVSNVSAYNKEIDALIGGSASPEITVRDANVEDASEFALEKHLEDFLVKNWHQCDLGKDYDIYTEEGEMIGQQFPSDTGPIDILAISKDRKELLVVELKRGRASDNVVGQILRYMGYVRDELAEDGQVVKGAIIAFEDSLSIRRALSATTDIDFYTYKIQFDLAKV